MNIMSLKVNASLLSAMLAVIPKHNERGNRPHVNRIVVDYADNNKGIELAATDGTIILFGQDENGTLEKADMDQMAFLSCVDSDNKLLKPWSHVVKRGKKDKLAAAIILGDTGEICDLDAIQDRLPVQNRSAAEESQRTFCNMNDMLSIVHLSNDTYNKRIMGAMPAHLVRSIERGETGGQKRLDTLYDECVMNDQNPHGYRQFSPKVLSKLGLIGERLHANCFIRNHPAHMIKADYDTFYVDRHVAAKAYALTEATRKAWRDPVFYDQFFGAARGVKG